MSIWSICRATVFFACSRGNFFFQMKHKLYKNCTNTKIKCEAWQWLTWPGQYVQLTVCLPCVGTLFISLFRFLFLLFTFYFYRKSDRGTACQIRCKAFLKVIVWKSIYRLKLCHTYFPLCVYIIFQFYLGQEWTQKNNVLIWSVINIQLDWLWGLRWIKVDRHWATKIAEYKYEMQK